MQPRQRLALALGMSVTLLLSARGFTDDLPLPANGRAGSLTECPITEPPDVPLVPPTPYPPSAPYGHFWYGSEALWTMLTPGGTWAGLPRNADGFRQKVFWWRPGFDGRLEPTPDLRVSGVRLDGPGAFVAGPATNASHKDFGGWAMLTGVDVPSVGCWELTGSYDGHVVSFVVLIHS